MRERAVDLKQMDVDMAAYNARRLFRDHDKLDEMMREYAACAARRPDLFENESSPLAAWRAAFVQNSAAFAGESRAHAELAEHAAHDDEAGAAGKSVRFCDGL